MSVTEELRCLQEGDDCSGPVKPRLVGDSLRAWPRCEKHYEDRLEAYENSMERFARSDVPPAWFDPSDAGEAW